MRLLKKKAYLFKYIGGETTIVFKFFSLNADDIGICLFHIINKNLAFHNWSSTG